MNLIYFLNFSYVSVLIGFVLAISEYQLSLKNENKDDIKFSKSETITILLQMWVICAVRIAICMLSIIGLLILGGITLSILVPSI